MESLLWTVLIVTTVVSLSVVTILLNVTVMACLATEQKLQTTPGMYMFSLAVADGLVGLLVMPAMSVYTIYGQWPLGQLFCTLWLCTDTTFCTTSTLHVLLLAHDRYLALYRPIEYRTTHTRQSYALKRIAAAWAIGCAAWLPGVLYYRSVPPTVDNECFFVPAPAYVLSMSTIVDYLPLLLIVVVYLACVSRLRKRFSRIASSHQNTIAASVATEGHGDGGGTTGDGSNVQGSSNNDTSESVLQNRERDRRRRHVRCLRLLGAVIAAYAFCWLPYCVFWPITAYCAECISANLFLYSYWSAYVNSTINPLLYFAFQCEFRNAFRALPGRMCRCR